MEGSKILVILEDFDLRIKITEILKIGKYHVKSTGSGKQAIDIIRKNPVDVIISGINVAEIDGFGILRVANKFMETAGINFIMLLNDKDYDLARRVMELGADGYLMNPFDDGELLNQVEVRLRKKRLQHELFLKQNLQLRNIHNSRDDMSWLRSRFEGSLPRHFKKNQILYYRGERRALGLHYILSGKIKTYVTDTAGNVLITGIYGPHEYFGLQGALLGAENKEIAEAIDSAEILTIPFAEVQHLISSYPEIFSVFAKDLAQTLSERDERLLDIAYYSVRKRIAKAIIGLSRSGHDADNGSFMLPRSDLACLVGIASETLSRVLGDFTKERLIEKEGNNIIVLNINSLMMMKN
ncbi:response regulator [Pedobacter kyonggii]|uniref:Response regulator n=1 Tax=Pedobacter kyonggii TaxID=1926871 RepID=A0A4Q9HHE2_9SPHI|nr:response regulator [Pedobacter kyonggii]TBO44369.1 response regulator [Pedobacter kyonggii]